MGILIPKKTVFILRWDPDEYVLKSAAMLLTVQDKWTLVSYSEDLNDLYLLSVEIWEKMYIYNVS